MTEIDVSGCKFYYDTYCNDDNYLYGACAERDCYYKRLKRLEQENAKLKEKLEKIKEYAETALKANYCNNCDGVGIPECGDYECHTCALDKIMDVIKGAEDE